VTGVIAKLKQPGSQSLGLAASPAYINPLQPCNSGKKQFVKSP